MISPDSMVHLRDCHQFVSFCRLSSTLVMSLSSSLIGQPDKTKLTWMFLGWSTVPHAQLKSRSKELIQRCLSKKEIECFSTFLLVEISLAFVKSPSKSNTKYKQDEVIQMLVFISTTYMSSLVDKCFNKRSVFKWALIVLRCLPIYSSPFSLFYMGIICFHYERF